ncbi:MAG: HAD family hydrolase [Verrucomicrobiota bacterium]|nr:HAD family hydrolase [Verrucomicrobiota bacterium]
MIRAIFFDMGGTLDGGVHWLERFLALYAERGIELPRETIRLAFDAAELRSTTDTEIAETDLTAMVALHVKWQMAHLQLTDPGLAQRLVEKFVAPMRIAAAANRQLLADLIARGFQLGVVSNGCGNVSKLCADFGYAPYLSVIIDSRRVGLYKPDPAIFIHAAKEVGREPETILMVGDSLARDVRPAKAIGMKTAWLQSDDAEQSDEADFNLHELAELPGLLTMPACVTV